MHELLVILNVIFIVIDVILMGVMIVVIRRASEELKKHGKKNG